VKIYLDRDNILTQIDGSTSIHPQTVFTESDASRAILLLDTLGFDILVFGWWENGIVWETNRPDQGQITEV
jgi:hypothetical protein